MTSSNQTKNQNNTQISDSGDRHFICLHGFLGLPSDWDLLDPIAPQGWAVYKENLWTQIADFKTWAQMFCDRMRKLPGDKVLLGYSMEGRLAMHALMEAPDIFSGAILVSANPGLKTNEERRIRLQADCGWAEKFRKLPWDELMVQWNSQGVFNQTDELRPNQIELSRNEMNFDRELLAEAMELWSLGYQKDFEPLLKEFEIPILSLTGRADTKFTALSQALSEKPAKGDRPHIVVEQAGHRVPWDAPEDFRANVAKFLGRWYR